MTSRAARMEKILIDALQPAALTLEDESHRHAGHAGAQAGGQTHYQLAITSHRFTGLSRVERTRMVNALLQDEFRTGLHALSLRLRAPED